jgi:hypothetical protein
MFLVADTTWCSAQLKEVKWVTSQMVCYEDCKKKNTMYRIYEFKFGNLNDFPVFVAEALDNFLADKPNFDGGIVEKKASIWKIYRKKEQNFIKTNLEL